MKYKIKLILLLSFFVSKTYSQTINIDTKYDIIHVVSNGNAILNKVYKSKGMPQGNIRQCIFSTNELLLSIRSKLSNTTSSYEQKIQSVKEQVLELDAAIHVVSDTLDDSELILVVNKINRVSSLLFPKTTLKIPE